MVLLCYFCKFDFFLFFTFHYFLKYFYKIFDYIFPFWSISSFSFSFSVAFNALLEKLGSLLGYFQFGWFGIWWHSSTFTTQNDDFVGLLKSMLEDITRFFFLFFQFYDIEILKNSSKTLAKLINLQSKKIPHFFLWKATIFATQKKFVGTLVLVGWFDLHIVMDGIYKL